MGESSKKKKKKSIRRVTLCDANRLSQKKKKVDTKVSRLDLSTDKIDVGCGPKSSTAHPYTRRLTADLS